jgi:phosphotransferase system HPr (HPr) family protein
VSSRLRLSIVDPTGLHARPAARFVQAASRFASRVTVEHAGREADAKSLIGLLSLALRPGSLIELVAEGDDENEAITVLAGELAPYVREADTATTERGDR